MDPQKIRSQQDETIFTALLEHPAVQQVIEKIARQEMQGPNGTRRRLLATAVKLSKNMAPTLNKIAQDCIEKLEVDIPTELYAYNSAQFNAACVKPEEGKLFIMFSSALLDAFDNDELRFVMGHELGHFIYHHHDIPVGYLLRGSPPIAPGLALQLTSWSRYAEFSADRAGALCVNKLDAVARSLFKLASGVTSAVVQFNLNDFLQQVDEMRLEDAQAGLQSSPQDWFMTHPFSPLRVKALQLFHRSELMAKNGISTLAMETGIEGLMGLMEPSYLEAKTEGDKAMRHMLFAAALAVANADGNISSAEIDVFEKFFGQYQYHEKLDIDKLTARLPVRAQRVIEHTSVAKRMQLMHDLCVMARAEGKAAGPAIGQLHAIAHLLEVPGLIVEQALCSNTELD
ncbi:MAG: M48 family metallopeptidase [Pseudomonadales bacterium]|nr:M48 family metallopeptidase [Gammaproteobacteria bacterium]NNL56703.1 M48 family metallopeptidase [Pseudomonadales bacterium]